jgi:competence protein ComFC
MLHAFLGLLYPARCVGCTVRLENQIERQYLSDWACAACVPALPELEEPICQRCGEAYPGSAEQLLCCDNCADRGLAFEYARSGYHAQGLVRDLVHQFKYEKKLYLRRVLGILTLKAMEDTRLQQLLLQKPVLVPVPLHPTRLRQRGFNQSQVIAEELARALQLEMYDALERLRPTEAQANLTRAQRLKNLSQAFGLRLNYARDGSPLRGRAVILIDDVFTTGATTHECARLLRREGKVEKVVVVTAARG